MELFNEKEKDKIIIYKHFYEPSIPFKGWIHNCFLCNSITSRYQRYLDSKKYYVIVCKNCSEKFNNKPYAVIKKYILKNNLK